MIAVFGGSFNPFHNGHKSMAMQAINQLKVDKLILLPCKRPPHKSASDYASDSDRLAMLNELSADNNKIIVEDYEINLDAFSYTAKTLPVLKEKYKDDLVFILGGDSLENFANWYEPENIVKYADIAVCIRDDCDEKHARDIIKELKKSIGGNYHILNFEAVDISSSEIRRRIKADEDYSSMVPASIHNYIKSNNLYKSDKVYSIDELKAEMEKSLSEKRYIHSLGVLETAEKLAIRYSVDVNSARVAAILHDSAKKMSAKELVNLCIQNHVDLDPEELVDDVTTCNLVHSKAGMILAKNFYNISDEDVLNSIYYHTVGRPDMSNLEKIIYVSDFIEPNRTQNCNPSLHDLRNLVFEDLDKAVYYITKSTYDYLKSSGKPIYYKTIETLDFYEKII